MAKDYIKSPSICDLIVLHMIIVMHHLLLKYYDIRLQNTNSDVQKIMVAGKYSLLQDVQS